MEHDLASTLAFPVNDAGEEEGLNDPGIETFRDAPYESVAREHGQNSADAPDGSGAPVELRFDLIEVPADEYPPRLAQLEAVEACLGKVLKAKDEKAIDFFVRAAAVLRDPTLKVLRIADFNTTGLRGPAVPGTPFHSLVKSTGISNKETDTSGGSYGIGKNAAPAASELQTVFYSTVYTDGDTGQDVFLAQGKTRLVSHTGLDGSQRRATGYWGRPGFAPVSDSAEVPGWLRRDETGTSVFVIGLRDVDGWQHRIAASLIQNFFCAIHDGTLRFAVDHGALRIDPNTLAACFEDPAITGAVTDHESFSMAADLYRCLVADKAVHQELAIEGLGRIGLTMLMDDGLPRRIMIVRNGMTITDSLEHFGDKFARFPMYRDFVAIVRPMDADGSTLIKRLESPRHNALSAERLPDAQKRRAAVQVMKRLVKAIRSAIKEYALPKPEDEVTLDELAEFFSDADQTDRPPQPSPEEIPETFTYEPASRRRRRSASGRKGRDGAAGGAGGTRRGRGSGDRGRGAGEGRGTGGTGTYGGADPLVARDFRNLTPAGRGPTWRRLFFTPDRTCAARLQVRATGLDSPAGLWISAADSGTAARGSVRLNVAADVRTSLEVELSEPYEGPIELVLQNDSAGVEE